MLNRKLKSIVRFVFALCLCMALAAPALAANEISLIDIADVDQNTRSAVPEADMLIMTKSQSIPVYLEDNISSAQVDEAEVRGLLLEAENKAEDTDYNLFVIEDDLTYFYADVNGEVSVSVFETQNEAAYLDKDVLDNAGISPLAYGIEKQSEFPKGIGCKAYTENSLKTKFEATFYTTNINYAGSTPNNSSDTSKIINLYNYIGNVETSGIATDLGVQYSAKYGAWQPYFLYNGDDKVGGTMSGVGLYYKGAADAPTTIAIDRYARYNNLIRFKLTVSGKTTNNTNGQTVVFGGKPLDSSIGVQFKVVSTIGSQSLSNIKSGAGFNTYWTNVKIDGTPVSGYSTAYYWNGTISKLSSAGADFKLSKK